MGGGSDQDLLVLKSIMQNYSVVQLALENRKKITKEATEAVLVVFSNLFKHIQNITTEARNKQNFLVDNFAMAECIVADASKLQIAYMQFYRNLFLNRSASYTRNKTLLIRLLVEYYSAFLNALGEHEANLMALETMFQMSLMSINTKSSSEFIKFIQGPLADALEEKRKIGENAIKNKDANGSGWRKDAVKA